MAYLEILTRGIFLPSFFLLVVDKFASVCAAEVRGIHYYWLALHITVWFCVVEG